MKCGIICITMLLLLTMILMGCSNTSPQLQNTMSKYTEIINKEKVKELYLTIHFIDPHIFTRMPLSTEDLIAFPGVTCIDVAPGRLAEHIELLKSLNASSLTIAEEKEGLNARIYYVIGSASCGKLLEIVINYAGGNVFVNGIEVKDAPIFYELILPFLTQEERSVIGF